MEDIKEVFIISSHPNPQNLVTFFNKKLLKVLSSSFYIIKLTQLSSAVRNSISNAILDQNILEVIANLQRM